MKQLCFDCKHVCHCPGKGTTGGCPSCNCQICNHLELKSYEDIIGESMFKKIWKKIVEWLWK